MKDLKVVLHPMELCPETEGISDEDDSIEDPTYICENSESDDKCIPYNLEEDEENDPNLQSTANQFSTRSGKTESINESIHSSNILEKKDISGNASTNNSFLNFSINTSPVGTAMKNPRNVVVNSCSTACNKLYACKYCGKLLQGKILRHLSSVHKNEEEVKKLMLIPKSTRKKGHHLSEATKARLEIISKLRNEGNFKHNLRATTEDVLITARRTGVKKPLKTLSEFRACPKCKKFLAKSSIYKHIPSCLGTRLNKARPLQHLHNMAVGDCLEKATVQLRKILSKLRTDDDETLIIKYDPLIISYGNLQASKFQTSDHHSRQIRAELRLLARLVLTLKRLDHEIKSASDIFNPKKIDILIKAANILGKFDEVDQIMKTPATARDVGRLVKSLKRIWVLECSESGNNELLEMAKTFMRSFKVKFPILIGVTVSESQTQMNITKGAVKLPKLDDIKKLNEYLVDLRRKAYNSLKNTFDFQVWKELSECTLISVLLLNRRRPGELQRLKLVHYNSVEQINVETNPDVYKKLTNECKALADKYSRILIRGKRNKKVVPVMLDREMADSLELILKYRKEAGISHKNPFVFALPSVAKENKFIEACPLLTRYSAKCKAEMPSTLRATELRKHIATTGISLNLTNNQVATLSEFMGHDIEIHKNIYRQRLPVNDILQVSKLLEKAQGVIQEENGKFVETNSDEDSHDEYEDFNEDISIMQSSHRSNDMNIHMQDGGEFEEKSQLKDSPCQIITISLFRVAIKEDTPIVKDGAKSKIKWTAEAQNLVLSTFGRRYKKRSKIDGIEIKNLIDSSPCLRGRRVPQIRALLQHRVDKKNIPIDESPSKEQKSTPVTSRNRIPNKIYLHFGNYIEKKKIPSFVECIEKYGKSPSLNKYSPKDLQDFVEKAIKFSTGQY